MRQHVRAVNLALNLLRALGEASLYLDYQADEKFTDAQFDEMVAYLESLKDIRVVCTVQGGNVQAARATHPLKFDVLDFDNLQAFGEDESSKEYKRLSKLDEEYPSIPVPVY